MARRSGDRTPFHPRFAANPCPLHEAQSTLHFALWVDLHTRALTQVMTTVGLGNTCIQREDKIKAVKSSPKNPVQDIRNLEEVRSWAKQHHAIWLKFLDIPKENEKLCPSGARQRAVKNTTRRQR